MKKNTESVKTKDRAIRSMRTITLLAILALVGSNIFWVYHFNNTVAEKLQTSFVATDMGTFMVSRNPDYEMQQYEVGNFANRFLTLLLQYDASTLEKNLRLALEWVGNEEERRKLFSDYTNGGVLDRIREYESSTVFEIDSIRVDTKARPVIATVYGVQYTLVEGERIPQDVGARMQISQLGSGRRERSNKNPWGMEITNLEFFAYNRALAAARAGLPVDSINRPNDNVQPEIIEEN